MTIEGTIQNGVVVLDNGCKLPDGTRVEVVVRKQTEESALQNLLRKYAGTVDGLPEDMAFNHDHYIHGAPKK